MNIVYLLSCYGMPDADVHCNEVALLYRWTTSGSSCIFIAMDDCDWETIANFSGGLVHSRETQYGRYGRGRVEDYAHRVWFVEKSTRKERAITMILQSCRQLVLIVKSNRKFLMG